VNLARLGKHSAIYGLSNVLGASATLLLLPLLTRHLATEQYGRLEVLTVFVTQVGVVVQLGLGSALFRSLLAGEADSPEARVTISTAYWTLLAVACIAVLALLPLAPALGHLLLDRDDLGSLVRWMLAKILFEAVAVIPMARLRLRNESLLYGGLNSSRVVVTLLLVVAALWQVADPLKAVVLAMVAESALFALLSSASAWRDLVPQVSREALKAMLAFGVPLIPYTFALTLLAMGDRYLLRHYGGLAEVGPYAVGFKLAAILGIPVRAFQIAWPSFLFSLAKEPDGRQVYPRVLLYVVLGLGWVGTGVAIFAPELMLLLATPAYAHAAVVVPILVFAQIALGVFYATAVGTNLTGKTYFITISAGVALLAFAAAGLVLVPRFGMVGAAIATMLGYVVMAGVDWWFSLRLYPVPYAWKPLAFLLAIMVGLILTGTRIHTGSLPGDIALKLGLLAAYPLLVLGLGCFPPAERRAVVALWDRVRRWRGTPPADRAMTADTPESSTLS
jgi:O-antigen/teichoic acid export membrane protein